MNAYCTHCGTKLPPGAAFCGACGTPVTAEPSNPAPVAQEPAQPTKEPTPEKAPSQPHPAVDQPVSAGWLVASDGTPIFWDGDRWTLSRDEYLHLQSQGPPPEAQFARFTEPGWFTLPDGASRYWDGNTWALSNQDPRSDMEAQVAPGKPPQMLHDVKSAVTADPRVPGFTADTQQGVTDPRPGAVGTTPTTGAGNSRALRRGLLFGIPAGIAIVALLLVVAISGSKQQDQVTYSTPTPSAQTNSNASSPAQKYWDALPAVTRAGACHDYRKFATEDLRYSYAGSIAAYWGPPTSATNVKYVLDSEC